MFTSRAEHRLLLREGNADQRLTPLGRELGLVDDSRWNRFQEKQQEFTRITELLTTTRVRPDNATRDVLTAMGASVPRKAVTLADVLRQPEMTLDSLLPLCPALESADPEAASEAEVQVKYEGYLARQAELVLRAEHQEQIPLPEDLDYSNVAGLTLEVVEKMSTVRPRTLGQAGRISGVTPAALSCIEVYLKKNS
jgi:tRNA uridine 5-carboxymethylaminomethyl modification enzyme